MKTYTAVKTFKLLRNHKTSCFLIILFCCSRLTQLLLWNYHHSKSFALAVFLDQACPFHVFAWVWRHKLCIDWLLSSLTSIRCQKESFLLWRSRQAIGKWLKAQPKWCQAIKKMALDHICIYLCFGIDDWKLKSITLMQLPTGCWQSGHLWKE